MYEILKNTSEMYPEKKFYEWCHPENDKAFEVSYKTFHKRVIEYSNRLSLILKKDDKVIISMKNSPEFLVVWFACAKIKVVSVLCNPNYCDARKKEIYKLVNASLIIGTDDDSDFEEKPLLLYRYAGLKKENVNLVSLKNTSCHESNASSVEDHLDSYNRDCTILMTSGTTGKPKAVVFKRKNIVKAIGKNVLELGVTSEDTAYVHLPMYHIIASFYQVLTMVLVGGSVVLRQFFNNSDFWESSARLGCSWSVLTRMDIAAMSINQYTSNHKFKFWLTSSKNICLEKEYGVKVIGCFGMSETLRPIMFANEERPIYKGCNFVGRPSSDFEVVLLDEDGVEIKGIGVKGRLHINPKDESMIFDRYITQGGTVINGDSWFDTGDIMQRDDRGHYYFCGRNDDIVKIGGEQVSTMEVENMIKALSLIIYDVSVLAVPDQIIGNRLVAFLSVTNSEFLKLANKIVGGFPALFRPSLIIRLNKLPMSILSKINKKELLSNYLNGDYEQNEKYGEYVLPKKSNASLEDQIEDIWKFVLVRKKICRRTPLVEQGGSSLDAVRIIALIRDELKIPIETKTLNFSIDSLVKTK